jgi:hypothetical protein
MTAKRQLGDPVEPGQLVRCPRCGKRHRVLQRAAGTLLDQIRCSQAGGLIVVGIEGRFLPQKN